jgi:hypothetical protein
MRKLLVGSCGIVLTTACASVAAVPRATHDVVVTGSVTDAEAGRPLAGAMVLLAGSSPCIRTAVARDGTYRLVIPATRGSRVTLGAVRIGMEGASRSARVSGDSMRIDFQLQAARLHEDMVVIIGRPVPKKRIPGCSPGSVTTPTKPASEITAPDRAPGDLARRGSQRGQRVQDGRWAASYVGSAALPPRIPQRVR